MRTRVAELLRPNVSIEHSPTDRTGVTSAELAGAIALEEYKAARSEIQDRVKNEFVLVTASATLTGAAATLLGQSSTPKLALFCGLPLLSFVLAFLHFAQESSIAVAAAYVNQRVAPRLRSLSGAVSTDLVLTWEDFRAQRLYRGSVVPRFLVAIGTSTPAMPGIILTVVLTCLPLWRSFRAEFHGLELTFLGIDWLCLLALGVLMRWNKALFDAITENPQGE
ncbi:hypothetical protein [Mycobacterium sp. 852002-40037_SCH5390672]|uniref:hypothetical protein n=1 Tax=Mycobacterium sp. 852002-40037_SCH5390672 TaxID=1834089 RepID=UPI0012E78530|nr:hypothetical protein [Mycobacterium sp. 852002-40037_SCH5390672]